MHTITLTVFFESPFWVAVIEKQMGSRLEVARHVFGAEPSDPEIYAWLQEHWGDLCFCRRAPGGGVPSTPLKRNPKWRSREARRAMLAPGASTAAQKALQQQLEQRKQARQVVSKAEREAQALRKFRLRQEKRRAKHQGH